jgi:hypothetical protein
MRSHEKLMEHGKMTIDQLIAEVAAQPTRVAAFNTFLACLKIEMADADVGDTPAPAVKSKYDAIFSQAEGKANEILTAIEKDKPHLEPLRAVPASAPGGPASPHVSTVFVDKPGTVVPSVSTAIATSNATAFVPSPFGTASTAPPPLTPAHV